VQLALFGLHRGDLRRQRQRQPVFQRGRVAGPVEQRRQNEADRHLAGVDVRECGPRLLILHAEDHASGEGHLHTVHARVKIRPAVLGVQFKEEPVNRDAVPIYGLCGEAAGQLRIHLFFREADAAQFQPHQIGRADAADIERARGRGHFGLEARRGLGRDVIHPGRAACRLHRVGAVAVGRADVASDQPEHDRGGAQQHRRQHQHGIATAAQRPEHRSSSGASSRRSSHNGSLSSYASARAAATAL